MALPGAIQRFRGEGSLRSFLLSMAINHARHHLRAAARRRAAMARFSRAGAPEPTIRSRVFHAKRKLREELEKRGVS